jgi:hypothetical protein
MKAPPATCHRFSGARNLRLLLVAGTSRCRWRAQAGMPSSWAGAAFCVRGRVTRRQGQMTWRTGTICGRSVLLLPRSTVRPGALRRMLGACVCDAGPQAPTACASRVAKAAEG